MTLTSVLAAAIVGLLSTTIHHEGTKRHEEHEVFLDKSILRDLRGPSCLRDKPVMLQSAASPRTIDQGDRSQVMSAREVVVRTAAEWDALWREHAPGRPVAAVDFSTEMVVGVFLGSKPTAGYGVTIVSAAEAGGVLHVRYRMTSPPADAITAQVITYPYQIVAIPKSSATQVRFEKVS